MLARALAPVPVPVLPWGLAMVRESATASVSARDSETGLALGTAWATALRLGLATASGKVQGSGRAMGTVLPSPLEWGRRSVWGSPSPSVKGRPWVWATPWPLVSLSASPWEESGWVLPLVWGMARWPSAPALRWVRQRSHQRAVAGLTGRWRRQRH